MSEILENRATESNICQSNEQINEAADEDDDVILICDPNPIIEIEDTDDESNNTSNNNQTFLSTPRILTDKTEVVNESTKHYKKQIKHVDDEEVKRIPLKKDIVEVICKHFGIDYNPEWSLRQIRNRIKERTRNCKQTPELREAMSHNRKPLHWCRGLHVSCLPDWFQHIHVVTLISLMSEFDVNKPTYYIDMKKVYPGDANANTGKCAIRFVDIEDCRQVFLDMQGIQCFNNDIKVRIDFGMYYKKFKLGRTRKVLEHIKLFRRQMKNRCAKDDGVSEINDSDEETSKSYSFPRLADIQANFKKKIDPDEEQNMPVDKTETLFVNKDSDDTSSSKNDEGNKVAPNSSNGEENNCKTVIMDDIPKSVMIHNFIKNAFGQDMQFISRKLNENYDNTVKYLVHFPTHQIAVKVCNQLNGIVVKNRKIEVKLKSQTTTDDENSKNDEKNEVAPNSSNEEENCRTVIMDDIPKSLELYNLFKNTLGHEIRFFSRKLNEHYDKTVKYLVHFPTHQIAVKVCNQLNGIVVNSKKIKVKLKLRNYVNDDVRRKLISDGSLKINQTRSKKSNTEVVPSATVQDPNRLCSFPRMADVQNNLKNISDPEKEHNIPDETDKIESVPQTCLLYENKDETPSSKNDEKNEIASNSKIKEETCTVVMDNIPNVWGNLVINNFIRNAVGQNIQFISRKLGENNDKTVKYWLKFPTHQIAVRVCQLLNGTVTANSKTIEVYLELGNDNNEDFQSKDSILFVGNDNNEDFQSKDSNLHTKSNQTQSKTSNTEIVPTSANVQDPGKLCSFPRIVDVQNNVINTNEPEKEHNIPDEIDKIESNSESCLFYEDRDGTPSSKNDETKKDALHSKIEEDSDIRIVIMDKIPNTWGNLMINNFVKNAIGQDVQFISRKLHETIDNTMKYVFKFPTHQIAVKVYNELNGTELPGNKKIEVKLDLARAYGEQFQSEDSNLYTVKRKLISDESPETSEPKKKEKKQKKRPQVISTTARDAVVSRNRLFVEQGGSAIQKAALLYQNPPQFNKNSNLPSNHHAHFVRNEQNREQQVAATVINNIEQPSFPNQGIPENDNKNRPSNHSCSTNTIQPSQNIDGKLKDMPILDTGPQEMQSQFKSDKDKNSVKPEKQHLDSQGTQALLKCNVDDEMTGQHDIVIKKEQERNSQDERFQEECNKIIQNIEKNRAFSKDNNSSNFSSSTGCRERPDMLIFKDLPGSVSSEALASKLGEVGEVLFCERTAAGRAVVRFKDPRHADRCLRLFHRSKVDGQVIDVTLVT